MPIGVNCHIGEAESEVTMNQPLLTPSKISDWLGCAHSLTLTNRVINGDLALPPATLNPLAEILVEKGRFHEEHCFEEYEAMGKRVHRVPGRESDETFEDWVARVGNPLNVGYPVIYQMPFIHDGIRGIADFLIRVDNPVEGYASYEPVDAKLTRSEAKPGHALQLCFYADALASLVGAPPREMHIWLGSGLTETLLVEEFSPYWRRLRGQLAELLEAVDPTVPTRPQPCDSCEYCDFQRHCTQQWREEDSLVFVATSRQKDRDALEAAAVRTVVELAQRRDSVPDVRDEKLARLTRQAALQVQSRLTPNQPPAFELIEMSDDPQYGHGFEMMPEPDEGDVFFDFEGDPFWTPQSELMFLAGLYYRVNGEWHFDDRWAHSLADQRTMLHDLITFFAHRRTIFPEYHVYHYNHTERSTIERLMSDADEQSLFSSLIETGLFVDLFSVARNAVRVGTESYGLKHLENLVDFRRTEGIGGGADAVIEYEQWMMNRDDRLLANIARYNQEDVMATLALRDWLVTQRPPATPWRPAVLEVADTDDDVDELVEALHAFAIDTPEHLLGDLLNYWRRERTADTAPKYAAMKTDYDELYDNPDFIANLTMVGKVEPTGKKKGRRIYTWPPQKVSEEFAKATASLYVGPGIPFGGGGLGDVDVASRSLKITWGARQESQVGDPTVLTVDDYFSPKPKPGTLIDIARRVIERGISHPSNALVRALLAGESPRFVANGGPSDGLFSDEVEDMKQWVTNLDQSFVAMQGPPGTGKTYSGSHLIHFLVSRGLRVGVMSGTHSAIDNLLDETVKVFHEANEPASLRILRWQDVPDNPRPGYTYSKKAALLEGDGFNVIGGTSWFWAGKDICQNPVDVLLIDEAGQLSLADAVVATNGAKSMLLLGDPQQLAQVAKADHPGQSGLSVLDHVLGEHATIPDGVGVFLSVSRRMHPDICEFISKQIYEGRLSSHESCRQQHTVFGTGLRWLQAEHEACSTKSDVEADIVVAQIRAMLGTPWVNQRGESAPLTPNDFMVVAPYNDQVDLLKARCRFDAELTGVRVGTVDKFQGQEAAVVFFTMTTSSSDDMPRGPEFLFSRHRLNVAISRARCIAYLVCTEALLNSRARDIENMRLISTLCAFVEYAQRHQSVQPRHA